MRSGIMCLCQSYGYALMSFMRFVLTFCLQTFLQLFCFWFGFVFFIFSRLLCSLAFAAVIATKPYFMLHAACMCIPSNNIIYHIIISQFITETI